MSKTIEKTPYEKALDALCLTGQVVHDAAVGTVRAVDDIADAIAMGVGNAAKAMGRAVGLAMRATGEHMTQARRTAVETAQKTLNEVEKKWLDLQAKITPDTDHAKVADPKAKDQMTQTLANAKARLVEARGAGADDWDQNVRPALDADLKKAQALYRDAAARFSDHQPM